MLKILPKTGRRSEPAPGFSTPRVGEIVRISESGEAWVDFSDNPSGTPIPARSLLATPSSPCDDSNALVGSAVLLVFENEDPALPIICGIVRKRLQPRPTVPVVTLDKSSVRDVLVDGRQLVFSAQQQILLRCGKSSVLLRRDGKIVIRGTNLLSRSSGVNRIKGGSIDLN